MPDDSGRLIAIGDVHGCGHALQILLEEISPVSTDQIVFLGDLIDQGRDTCAVLELILELRKQCHVVLIKGNHEEMMLSAQDSESSLRYWENCGGVATLNSYRFGALLNDVPPEHWELLASCQPYYETEKFILTHANYRSDVPMEEQEAYQLRWALFEPEFMQPHFSGKTVVVGHTEQKNSEILDLGFAVCIDTACWRHGWLTAIELNSGKVWQSSRWGIMREEGEQSHRGLVPVLR
jgi:serine/threonine protein phosphatase 1